MVVLNVKPDAPIASPLNVYASKVGSFAKVVPDNPRFSFTLAPLAYDPMVPDDLSQVTVESMYG